MQNSINERLNKIASHFMFEGEVISINTLGEGFINDTYVVETLGDAPNYILQRKNHVIFPNVPEMMGNIVKVCKHIKAKVSDPVRESLTVTFTKDNLPYYRDEEGNFWAACLFIPNTITYSCANSTELAYEGGVGIGRFQTLLADFTEPLVETIKGFHNIRWRFVQWDEAIAADSVGRVASLQKEIEWIESRRAQMLEFWSLVESGTIPTRVTHNDTKISNILFDKESGKVLCAIDLDTVMSSTSLNDFGDAIRSYTNTGAEDDTNLDNVSMDIAMFEAYTKGYLSERRESLTEIELEYLAFSARYITFEQVLRFLMDYICGDTYYKVKSADHNLERTHAQYKLLLSIEEQYAQMCKIVKEF